MLARVRDGPATCGRVDGHPGPSQSLFLGDMGGKVRARRTMPASSLLSENMEKDSLGYEPGERRYELEGTDSLLNWARAPTLETSG